MATVGTLREATRRTVCRRKLLTPSSGLLLDKVTAGELVRRFLSFIDPEDLFPCSREHATGHCPDSDESSQHPRTLFFNIHFNIVFPSTSLYFLCHFPSGFTAVLNRNVCCAWGLYHTEIFLFIEFLTVKTETSTT